MSTADLLQESLTKGVRFALDADFGGVLFSAPDDAVDDHLLAELQTRTPEITALLRAQRRLRVQAGDVAVLRASAIVREFADATFS